MLGAEKGSKVTKDIECSTQACFLHASQQYFKMTCQEDESLSIVRDVLNGLMPYVLFS
jgi:hypothetical protein